MGSQIEKALEVSISAFIKQDREQAQMSINSDSDIDHQERDIEALCLRLLLQQQPVAKDLRLISSALKMITDMERIGDHASDIAEMTMLMADKPYICKLDHIEAMAKQTTVMLHDSIDAFVSKDIELAGEVIASDDIVDAFFVKVKSDLIQLIADNPQNGEQAADLLMVAKYFERIGDHATNIAEWVIFSLTGRHKGTLLS